MLAYIFSSSIQEAEAGVEGQPGLHRELKVTELQCKKKEERKEETKSLRPQNESRNRPPQAPPPSVTDSCALAILLLGPGNPRLPEGSDFPLLGISRPTRKHV